MEKNTEYGAMIILSASSYGNKNKIADGQTTTGNASGVVMKINSEWVAAGAGLNASTYAKNAKARYINNDYGTTAGGKYHTGDAMDIGGWHSSGSAAWFADTSWHSCMRAYSGSVFSYMCSNPGGWLNVSDTAASYKWGHTSRAAIVVGSGI